MGKIQAKEEDDLRFRYVGHDAERTLNLDDEYVIEPEYK